VRLSSLPDADDNGVLWVVDSNHSFVDALTWVDQGSAKKVTSVDELVHVAQRECISMGCTIDFLAIFGHGTSGYQGVGCGQELDSSGLLSLRHNPTSKTLAGHLRGSAAKKVAALNGVLSDEAQVFLAGCSVGAGDSGTGLLTTMSRLLKGRAVHAFENEVFWWTSKMVGSLKSARSSTVETEWSVLSL
jgi:hypothetical protein